MSRIQSVWASFAEPFCLQAAQYWYNGEKRPARVFNGEMDEAREVIAPLVRSVLAARPRHPLEYDGDWVPNVAASNCYRGKQEVGSFLFPSSSLRDSD